MRRLSNISVMLFLQGPMLNEGTATSCDATHRSHLELDVRGDRRIAWGSSLPYLLIAWGSSLPPSPVTSPHRDAQRSPLGCGLQGASRDLVDAAESAHRPWQSLHHLLQRACALGEVHDDSLRPFFAATPTEQRSSSSDCLDTSHTIRPHIHRC